MVSTSVRYVGAQAFRQRTHKQQDLILNSCFDWKPVQVFQGRCHVIGFSPTELPSRSKGSYDYRNSTSSSSYKRL